MIRIAYRFGLDGEMRNYANDVIFKQTKLQWYKSKSSYILVNVMEFHDVSV